MKQLFLASIFTLGLAFVSAAQAAPTAPAQAQAQAPVEMVVMPKQLVEASVNWLLHPDASIAVQLYEALASCLLNNPQNGAVTRNGPDHCTAVTEELNRRATLEIDKADLALKVAEKDKAIKDLTDQITALKAKEAKPSTAK